jgi:hypothetical protein
MVSDFWERLGVNGEDKYWQDLSLYSSIIYMDISCKLKDALLSREPVASRSI